MISPTQLIIELPGDAELDATHYWAESEAESRGEVFTKNEVADFVLDLTGWRLGNELLSKRLLEPSCGSGDFVIPALCRLLQDAPGATVSELEPCIRAVEVNRNAFVRLKQRVQEKLSAAKYSKPEIDSLTNTWLHHGDFLTSPFFSQFTHVVGNPPYLRIESLPLQLMRRYRLLFRTMYDRADLYIAFFEKGLSLLQKGGKLGYICSNRWTKNRYGGPLRKMIAENYHVEAYIDFTGVDAFKNQVVAYPAVTIICNSTGSTTRVVEKEDIRCEILPELAESIIAGQNDPRVKEMSGIVDQSAPWLLSNTSRVSVIQELERQYPTLEEAGCKVGIGVATGADRVYIGNDVELDVEPDRKLPLLTRGDLKNHRIEWTGKYVLNPYDGDSSRLVELDKYPKFRNYIESHRDQICRRHVSKHNPHAWFKTIDRIYPDLKQKSKLVIPDIQGDPQVAYDPGHFYPHHNLYYITSTDWNLHALQAVLRSRLAISFIATYSLRMRGDCLRFQAQYLRRIRIPRWNSLTSDLQFELISAAMSGDTEQIDNSVRSLYGLDESDWSALTSN